MRAERKARRRDRGELADLLETVPEKHQILDLVGEDQVFWLYLLSFCSVSINDCIFNTKADTNMGHDDYEYKQRMLFWVRLD